MGDSGRDRPTTGRPRVCGLWGRVQPGPCSWTLWPRGVFPGASSVSIWRKDVASECLLPSFLLQLQSPEKPEFFLRHCDGSQHRFRQPAVPDLGGEPLGLHGEGGRRREREGGGGGTDKTEWNQSSKKPLFTTHRLT